MTRLAQTERAALCDTALQVGEDQPTLSGEWTVKDLVVHLLVREGSPAAVGILVKPLEKRIAARYEAIMLGTRVVKMEAGPRGITVHFEGDQAPAQLDQGRDSRA